MSMSNYISIAIDGPAGAGKSTMARTVAKELGYIYVDTGAIYRTVGLYAFRKGAAPENGPAVEALLPELNINMRYGDDGLQHMTLNGEDVTSAIRQHEISHYASAVSAIPAVRAFLLEMQRKFARENNVIMDGRDIGTVVLPDADMKIYLTANAEDRAHRRYLELLQRGQQAEPEQVLKDIVERDYRDMNRETAPLKQAEDAVLVDTTGIGLEESFQLMLTLIRDRLF